MKIVAPTYTQTPNDLFDHWLPHLKESELKVLLIIMRKTFGWHKVRDKISISQLAKLTGLTAETVVIAAKSLVKKGVILKQVIGPIGKQETFYELVVEDSNNSYPSENPSRPLGFTPLGESESQKKVLSPKEKQQQEAPASAAASSKNKDSPTQKEIYPCLHEIDIPKKEKVWLTRRYDEETVQYAIAYATSPQTEIKTTLVQTIKWACQNRPQMPKDRKSQIQANKALAQMYDERENKVGRVDVLNHGVEIVAVGTQSTGIFISYEENNFKEKLEEALKKYRLFE